MEVGMRQRIPSLRNSRRGNYMMTMGIFMPVLIGFGALSVDISYINMARTQTQNVADAASHAAYVAYRATGDTSVGDAAASFVVSENRIGNAVGTLELPVSYGEWDFDNRTFDANGNFINSARAVVSRKTDNSNQLDLFFAPILGHNHANVESHGVAAGRTRQMILISDVSGSFSGDIGKANLANIAFLDYMEQNPMPGDLLGHVVFAGTANFPDLHELASPVDDYDSLKDEFAKLDVCYRMPTTVRPTGNSIAEGGVGVPAGALRGSPLESACHTSQARGLHRALQEFIENGDDREFQAMLLLTDGVANTYLTENVNNGSGGGTAEDDAEQLIWWMWYGGNYSYDVWECDLGANNSSHPSCGLNSYSGSFGGGVHLWTVYFGSNGSNVAWLEYLVSIGVGNRGEAKNTDDPDELEAIYIEIASSIPVVLTD
jgi:hypothetical protein